MGSKNRRKQLWKTRKLRKMKRVRKGMISNEKKKA